MSRSTSGLHFYVPQLRGKCDAFADEILSAKNDYHPKLLEDYGIRNSVYCWIIQTWLYLSDKFDFPCGLTDEIPERGVFIALRTAIPTDWRPNPDQLFVCCCADKDPHQFAEFNVVGNAWDNLVTNPRARSKLSVYFIPHWPQIGIVARNPSRAATISHLVYPGELRNLAEEFHRAEFVAQVAELGCRFSILNRSNWHDFSQADLLLAVRGQHRGQHFNKPATKLYNAWHAGVPALLGPESAFRAERLSPLDYIEVSDARSVIDAIAGLKSDPARYCAMVENGRRRAKGRSTSVVTFQWYSFIREIVLPAYRRNGLPGAGEIARSDGWREGVADDPSIWSDLLSRCVGGENFS